MFFTLAPALISFNTACSSDATMFSSMTPNLILFSKFFMNLPSSITFPAPNISSTTILIESVTEALPPI